MVSQGFGSRALGRGAGGGTVGSAGYSLVFLVALTFVSTLCLLSHASAVTVDEARGSSEYQEFRKIARNGYVRSPGSGGRQAGAENEGGGASLIQGRGEERGDPSKPSFLIHYFAPYGAFSDSVSRTRTKVAITAYIDEYNNAEGASRSGGAGDAELPKAIVFEDIDYSAGGGLSFGWPSHYHWPAESIKASANSDIVADISIPLTPSTMEYPEKGSDDSIAYEEGYDEGVEVSEGVGGPASSGGPESDYGLYRPEGVPSQGDMEKLVHEADDSLVGFRNDVSKRIYGCYDQEKDEYDSPPDGNLAGYYVHDKTNAKLPPVCRRTAPVLKSEATVFIIDSGLNSSVSSIISGGVGDSSAVMSHDARSASLVLSQDPGAGDNYGPRGHGTQMATRVAHPTFALSVSRLVSLKVYGEVPTTNVSSLVKALVLAYEHVKPSGYDGANSSAGVIPSVMVFGFRWAFSTPPDHSIVGHYVEAMSRTDKFVILSPSGNVRDNDHRGGGAGGSSSAVNPMVVGRGSGACVSYPGAYAVPTMTVVGSLRYDAYDIDDQTDHGYCVELYAHAGPSPVMIGNRSNPGGDMASLARGTSIAVSDAAAVVSAGITAMYRDPSFGDSTQGGGFGARRFLEVFSNNYVRTLGRGAVDKLKSRVGGLEMGRITLEDFTTSERFKVLVMPGVKGNVYVPPREEIEGSV